MSMFDKLKAYSRKPAAVILATVMATSTIPTTPIAQAVTAAYAAESTQGQSAKAGTSFDAKTLVSDFDVNKQSFLAGNFSALVSKHIKDADGNPIKGKMTISEDTIVSLVNDEIQDSSFDSVFTYNENGDDPLSTGIAQSLKAVNDLLVSKNDRDKSVVYGEATYEGIASRTVVGCDVEVTGSNGLEVKKEGKNYVVYAGPEIDEPGNITIKVKSVDVAVTVNYKYTVTPTDNPEDVKTEHKTVESSNPDNSPIDISSKDLKIVSGKIGASEIYAGIDDCLDQANTTISGLTYKTEQTEPSVILTAALRGLKGTPVVSKENAEYFDVEMASDGSESVQSVWVHPKKAFNDGPRSFEIKWSYPDDEPAGTTTVTVPNIAPMPVSYSLPGEKDGKYTYRIKEAQQKKILQDANDAVKQAVKAVDGKAPTENYYSAVDLDVDASGAANSSTALKFTVNPDEKAVAEYTNFNVTDVPTANIDAVASVAWEKTDLVVKSDNGGSNSKLSHEDYKNGTWLNGNGTDHDGKVTASWTDYALSDEVPTEMSKLGNNLEMNKKEGVSENNQMYALDSEGVVTLVTGICYRRDTWAPVVNSAAVVNADQKSAARTKSITEELEANHKYVTKNLQISVNISDGFNNSDKSGLKDDSVKMSYSFGKNDRSDAGDSKEVTPDSSDKGTFVFDLSKNGANQRINSNNMKVSAYDNAGNHVDNLSVLKADKPMKYLELVQNAEAPTFTAVFDNNNVQREANGRGYYNANRTFTVSVTDPFFKYVQDYDPNQVIATLEDGGETTTITPGMLTRTNGDTWSYSYTFGAKGDADCKVSAVNYQNLAGTAAASTFSGDTFTIDKTAPKLNVSWNTEAAQNGKYYNAARTATITVEEHNFDPNLFKIEAPVSAGNGDEAAPAQIGGWTSNGDTHTATVTFPGQGVYTLSVSGEDLASNKSESYTSPEFVIDTIKPKIDIQNVVNRTAYAGEVAPTAAVHDTNLADGTSIEVSKISYPLSKDDPNPYAGAAINTSATDKSVSYLNPAKTKGNDGVYTLTVQAVDLAGNTESEAVTWSVNRFGSTYVISDNTGKMLDQYLKSAKTTDVKVTEINPSGLDDNKTSVELTRDTKNTTLKSGDNYTTDADTTSGWSEYNYTVSKSNYDKDGAYRVLFHSEDAAGNSSENTMEGKNAKKSGAAAEINFAVDDTAPIASFVDLASNGKYEESSHKAKVSFEDNLKLSKAQIKVNGKTVATFTADQLEKSPIREFTLDGSSSKQDVTVVAWDAAGNKSKELKATGVLVTNDSFVLWMNNLPLMVGTIVAIVVVAGGIYLVVAKKRKENEEK